MRVISIILVFVFLAVSGILLVNMFSMKNDIDSSKSDIEYYGKLSDTYTAEIETLSSELSEVVAKADELQVSVDHLLKLASYKTVPTVFLSFDDGTSGNTIKILDILAENDVVGTFFVVGSQVENNGAVAKEAVKRIVEEGHTLGIHCYTHDYKLLYSSVEGYFEDFYKARDLLISLTGYEPKIVRLPSGTSSARSFCEQYSGTVDTYYAIVSRLYAEGYTVVDWNIDTEDWNSSSTVDSVVSAAETGAKTRLTREYKTAVVLMHDSYRTYEALPTIISSLKEMGYANFERFEQGGYVTRQVAATEKPQ